ncbi:uncharacterized protein LOC143888680 [Tasmannia lanceolata]|uniref:uncharacterized protein LOC143888680 n=1 Tax=Tasmannia lanceolata TaxID=3420 RepID=UPI00406434FF
MHRFPGLSAILGKSLSIPGTSNQIIWKPSSDGTFSLKSAWDILRPKHPKAPWASSIWFSGHIPKQSVTSWQALLHDFSCPLCSTESESINHLFFRCSFLHGFGSLYCGDSPSGENLLELSAEEEWIRLKFKGRDQLAKAIRIAFTTAIYHIWVERNVRIHETNAETQAENSGRHNSHYQIKVHLSQTQCLPQPE